MATKKRSSSAASKEKSSLPLSQDVKASKTPKRKAPGKTEKAQKPARNGKGTKRSADAQIASSQSKAPKAPEATESLSVKNKPRAPQAKRSNGVRAATSKQPVKAKKRTPPTDDAIRVRAYLIAEERHRQGRPGSPEGDWHEAQRQLLEEADRAS